MIRQPGFTLIELAIVLVIVTILVGGLAMPLSAQIEARRIGETRKTMEEAREAILGYAMSHSVNVSPPTTCTCVYKSDNTLNPPDIPLDASDDPDSTCPVALCPTTYIASAAMTVTPSITRHYLPCPDMKSDDPEPNLDNDGDGTLSDLNNGREDRSPGIAVGNTGPLGSNCAAPSSSGNLPWVTLGTAAQDAWGNRLQYAIDRDYGNSANGFTNAFIGDRQICSTSTGGCASGTIARDIPAVVISYGPNGWGALNVNNSVLANPASADEQENTNLNTAYVSRSPTKPGAAAGEFDDLVVWLSHQLLISRVCPAPGGCP